MGRPAWAQSGACRRSGGCLQPCTWGAQFFCLSFTQRRLGLGRWVLCSVGPAGGTFPQTFQLTAASAKGQPSHPAPTQPGVKSRPGDVGRRVM